MSTNETLYYELQAESREEIRVSGESGLGEQIEALEKQMEQE